MIAHAAGGRGAVADLLLICSLSAGTRGTAHTDRDSCEVQLPPLDFSDSTPWPILSRRAGRTTSPIDLAPGDIPRLPGSSGALAASAAGRLALQRCSFDVRQDGALYSI